MTALASNESKPLEFITGLTHMRVLNLIKVVNWDKFGLSARGILRPSKHTSRARAPRLTFRASYLDV